MHMRLFRQIIIYIIGFVIVFLISFSTASFIDVQLRSLSDMQRILMTVFITLIYSFAYYALVYMNHSREQSEIFRTLKLNEGLYDLLHEITNTEKEEEVYGIVLDYAIRSLANGDMGSILDLRQPEKIRYSAVSGFDRSVLEHVDFRLEDTFVFLETEGRMDSTVIIDDAIEYNRKLGNGARLNLLLEAGLDAIGSTIATPIRVGGQVVGILNVDSRKSNAFSEEDIEIIELFSKEVSRMIRYSQVMEENLYLSRYDALTKAYNRGYFYELHKQMYRDREVGSYVYIATDLNNLKTVNDTYGHLAGDKLIRHFARTVMAHIDEAAVFGRYGGDEFNILMPHATAEAAESVISGVMNSLANSPIYEGDEAIFVSFSFGIVNYPAEAKGYKEIIRLGDQRMYNHKNSKRDTLKG